MPTDGIVDAIFVSCDIIGHSDTGDHDAQSRRLVSLNACIRDACGSAMGVSALWASGGDGGHMTFLDETDTGVALALINALFHWQRTAGIGLRLTAHGGPVALIEGADGRREVSGDGINLCGSLLHHGTAGLVLASGQFRDAMLKRAASGDAAATSVRFDNEQIVYLKHRRATLVMAMSREGAFTSQPLLASRSDRHLLDAAVANGDPWTIIYYAKRLLQVDSADPGATAALQTISPNQLVMAAEMPGRVVSHPLLSQMNRQSLHDMVRAAPLVEREDGDVICAQGDTGDAMFIVVRGAIGVSVSTTGPDGEVRPIPLDVSFTAGQMVGELALALMNHHRTATLQAIGATAFLSISYATLRGLLDERPVNIRLQRAFNEFLLSRSLRYICGRCDYLAQGDDAPLSAITEPWDMLADDAEQLKLDWREAESQLMSPDRFEHPGLYILAGGSLVEASQNAVVAKRLHASDLPIVYADLPGGFVSRNLPYQLDPDGGPNVNIIRVSDRALKAFGPAAYARLLSAVRRQFARQFVFDAFISYSHRDEPIASAWKAAMEDAGLRVYMSRPDAMHRFKPEIELALAESLVMLAFVSEHAIGPDGQPGWVHREIDYRKSVFDEAHSNILPVELTRGLSPAFADGFSAIVATGNTERDVDQAIAAIKAVRSAVRPPPFALRRDAAARI